MKHTLYHAIGLLRLKNKTILCFDEQLTREQIKEYRLMGYGVAIL